MCQILESGEDTFMPSNEVTKYYNVTMACMCWWANKGEVCILRLGELGKHLYNAKDLKSKIVIISDCGDGGIHQHRKRIAYAHVSSKHQQGDLEHQVGELRWLCPDHEIVTNVARYISQTCQKQQNGPPPKSHLMLLLHGNLCFVP
jgi:predicted site-specific integrase-resolvase